MTKKDKELLLKDLSAQLPYDTIISVNDGKYRKDVKLHPHYIFDWYAEQWLKSLKDRVQPQQKQEWSEEDENRFNNLIRLVEKSNEGNATKQGFITFINKFKSIKPQWKPSEEQIEAFEYFVKSIGESGYASPYDNNTKLIYSLLNDLKKTLNYENR